MNRLNFRIQSEPKQQQQRSSFTSNSHPLSQSQPQPLPPLIPSSSSSASTRVSVPYIRYQYENMRATLSEAKEQVAHRQRQRQSINEFRSSREAAAISGHRIHESKQCILAQVNETLEQKSAESSECQEEEKNRRVEVEHKEATLRQLNEQIELHRRELVAAKVELASYSPIHRDALQAKEKAQQHLTSVESAATRELAHPEQLRVRLQQLVPNKIRDVQSMQDEGDQWRERCKRLERYEEMYKETAQTKRFACIECCITAAGSGVSTATAGGVSTNVQQQQKKKTSSKK